MTSPIRLHSTMSVTANAKRHCGASGMLLPGAVSRESAALTSLSILSLFRPLSINTYVHNPCIPAPTINRWEAANPPLFHLQTPHHPIGTPGLHRSPFPTPSRIPLRYALLVTTKSLRRSREFGESLREAETAPPAIAKPTATISTLPAA